MMVFHGKKMHGLLHLPALTRSLLTLISTLCTSDGRRVRTTSGPGSAQSLQARDRCTQPTGKE